jgi:hypothetical protein
MNDTGGPPVQCDAADAGSPPATAPIAAKVPGSSQASRWVNIAPFEIPAA